MADQQPIGWKPDGTPIFEKRQQTGWAPDGTPVYADAPTPPPQGMTPGGLAKNIGESATRFYGGLAQMIRHPLDTATALGVPQRPGESPALTKMPQAIVQQYARLAAHPIDTFYNDPVGTIADVGALSGASGGLLKATRMAPRIAAGLETVSEIANPVRWVTSPGGRLMREAGITAADITIRPPARIRRAQDVNREVAKTVVDEGLLTSNMAKNAADKAYAESTRLADQSAATVSPTVMTAYPRTAERLGNRVPSTPDLYALDKFQQAQRGELGTAPISVRSALDKGREADRQADTAFRAQDMGHTINDVEALARKEFANNTRGQLRATIPGIRDSQSLSRRATAAEQALLEAESRPADLTRKLAVMSAGGGWAAGSPEMGLTTAAMLMALNSPKVGATVGTGLRMGGQAVRNVPLNQSALYAQVLRDALMARLAQNRK